MTEQDRIEALFEEGRITRDQADVLKAALEPEGGSVGTTTPDQSRNGAAERTAAQIEPEADSGHQWLELSALGGDFDIEARAGLTFPESADGTVTATAAGARIAVGRSDEDGEQRNFIDRIIDRISTSKMKIFVPEDWGVLLNVTGGDIDIIGPVAAVRGRLMAGDLNVSETSRVEVTVSAGEAEVGLRASSGSHRVQVHVGSADVRVLPGSLLEVDASVNVGNISSNRLASSQSGVVGATARGHIGQGAGGGQLSVSVATGDARINEYNRA